MRVTILKLQKLFPWSRDAWASYSECRSVLWWPLSYLFLAPLAVLIVFGAIIPLGLNQLGWISFNYSLLNNLYMLVVSGLVFFVLFPFLDGLYQLIKAHLDGERVDEHTGFMNLWNSKPMAMSMGPIVLSIVLLELLGSLFKPFKLGVLAVYVLVVFTPILTVYDPKTTWQKAWESIQFALNNKKILAQVWGMRLLVLMAIILPWVLVAMTGEHKILKIIAILIAIPGFIYAIVKCLPFYFYYPAYVHQQMKRLNIRGVMV